MGVSPWYVGATHIPLASTFVDDSGAAIDLTGAVVVARLQVGSAPSAHGTGVLVVSNAAAGTFTYQFSAADLAVAGPATIQFLATYPDGSVVASDFVSFVIAPTL